MPGSRFLRRSEVHANSPVSIVSELNLILLGPPGAGKGTQAERLQEDFELDYIATGDILRKAVAEETELGQQAKKFMDNGELVPDDVIIGVILEEIESGAQDGFLLDGFPRNVPQAQTLKKILDSEFDAKLDIVLELVVDEDEVVRRLSGRRTCSRCGKIWHVDFDDKKDDICDDCGGGLFQRDDDKEDVVRHRLEVYQEQTAPLVEFYADEGILSGIDATGPVEEVTERALSALRRFAG